jgi:hypothetical protein
MSAVCPEGMSSALLESRAGAAECAGLICRNGGSAIFIGNGGDGGEGAGTGSGGAGGLAGPYGHSGMNGLP